MTQDEDQNPGGLQGVGHYFETSSWGNAVRVFVAERGALLAGPPPFLQERKRLLT